MTKLYVKPGAGISGWHMQVLDEHDAIIADFYGPTAKLNAARFAALPEFIDVCVEYRDAAITVQTDASHAAGLRFNTAHNAFDAMLFTIKAIQ